MIHNSVHGKLVAALQERLMQSLPGREAQERMSGRVRAMPAVIPQDAKPSAVLILLFPKQDKLHVLLIKRTEDGRAHGGQISFPGGRQEPEDANLNATALREANEEVGVVSSEVNIVGGLSPLYIPVSNFQVFPFVAFAQRQPVYSVNRQEVDHILEVPMDRLFHDTGKIITEVRPASVPGLVLRVPAYDLQPGMFIWGATAMILSELEVIWQELEL